MSVQQRSVTVAMLRRKRLPEHLVAPYEAALVVLDLVEQAKGALTACVPRTRLPGRPLAEGIAEFEEHLRTVESRMPDWHRVEVRDVWEAAAGAVAESLARAERLRTAAPELGGFEGVVGTIDSLLAPLEAFEGVAPAFRRLRT